MANVLEQRDIIYKRAEEMGMKDLLEFIDSSVRAVRQGKLDWYVLLHKYGRKELDQVLEWNV